MYKHPILKSIDLIFFNDNDKVITDEIYNTVIIGANGIGKSHLLKTIVDIFNYVISLKEGIKITNDVTYRFHLVYSIDDDVFEISSLPVNIEVVGNGKREIVRFWINGMEATLGDCRLPGAIIASTMTVADKFNSSSNSIYQYKGIRNERSPSTTGTKTLVRKTVNGILSFVKSRNGYKEELRGLLSHLGLKDQMLISYGMRHKEVFLRTDMSPELLNDIFSNRENYFPQRETDIWGKTFFQKIKNQQDKIEIITDFLQRVARHRGKPTRYVVEYDVLGNDNIVHDAEAIQLLSKLDILTFPTIKVFKEHDNYNLMESSSGETHLLCQFIGILSAIKENSLIIIDEPENSSHPNWQINYICWLKEIFRKYNSCHFVIATHSHFILTDLKENSSTIIALEKENGSLHNIAQDLNTFCWSVDDILYNVFHVRNTRNRAFEGRMIHLYKLLSNREGNAHEINALVSELERYRLSDDDPLNKLLNIARNQYAELD